MKRAVTIARRITIKGGVVLAIALTAYAAQVQPGSAGDKAIALVDLTPKPAGELDRISWAISSEPASLDWIRNADNSTGSILANVCEGLLRLAPDLTLEPALAKSFEHPDATTWIYRLHDGVTFHDGSPLTAADVVFMLICTES